MLRFKSRNNRSLFKNKEIQPKNDCEAFYLNGFAKLPIRTETQAFKDGHRFLENIRQGQLDSGSFLEEKEPHYFILRNTNIDGISLLHELLHDSGLPELMRQTTGAQPYLANISVILHKPKIHLNTQWHRDTHFLKGTLTGPIPPGLKIYYYPRFEGPSLPRIEFLAGSHRYDLQSDASNKQTEKRAGNEVIFSANDSCALFDTTTLHRVVPDKDREGSMRILFSFYRLKEQLSRFPSPLDEELQQIYQKRMQL